jgi:Tol biopolymer transport system component
MTRLLLTMAAAAALLAEPGESTRPLARMGSDAVIDAPASLSADGRYVAFESRVRLVPADTNDGFDVYVLDRTTGRLTLESVGFDGGAGNGSSGEPRLSDDGRWLVFQSGATNLTRESGGRRVDVYLRDRLTGLTRGLTRPRPECDSTTAAVSAVISGDGRVVAFASSDPFLVPGSDANGTGKDVYVLTVATGLIVRASVTTRGEQPAGGISFSPSLNADGTIVAFTSSADLEGGGAAALETPQIFVRDLAHGTTRLVSATPDGHVGNKISHGASLSADGRMVSFVSMASNLGPSDGNSLSDVYVRDLQTGVTTLVSRTRRGKAANGSSSRAVMSADGQFVAFVSEASDLICERRRCLTTEVDDNLLPDVYLADVRTGALQRVSGSAEQAWWTASQAPAIDAHGTAVAFPSKEPIDPRDVNNDFDLFLWLRPGSTPSS